MAEKTGLHLDASQFLRGMKAARGVVMDSARRRMAQAGMQLMNDAIMEPPTVPIRTGDLRSSGSVFVQGQLHGVSPSVRGPEGGVPIPTPALHDDARPKGTEVLVRVGFNRPYAAKWHEVPARFREPGSGNKYLEAKMAAHGTDYMAGVASGMKKDLVGGA